MAAEGGYKYPRWRPRRQTRVVRVRPGETFGANDRHNGIDPTESGLPGQCRRRRRRVDIPLAPKMMMVREETSSHYYFYYSYTRRSRSRSRRTGRKAGVVRTHTRTAHACQLPPPDHPPSLSATPCQPRMQPVRPTRRISSGGQLRSEVSPVSGFWADLATAALFAG